MYSSFFCLFWKKVNLPLLIFPDTWIPLSRHRNKSYHLFCSVGVFRPMQVCVFQICFYLSGNGELSCAMEYWRMHWLSRVSLTAQHRFIYFNRFDAWFLSQSHCFSPILLTYFHRPQTGKMIRDIKSCAYKLFGMGCFLLYEWLWNIGSYNEQKYLLVFLSWSRIILQQNKAKMKLCFRQFYFIKISFCAAF